MAALPERDPEPVAMLLVGPAAEAVRAAEARESGLLPGCSPPEERLEGEIQSFQDALGLMRMHEAVPARQVATDLLQGLLLVRARDANGPSPGADALLERGVPQILQHEALGLHRLLLSGGWIELVAEGSCHGHGVESILAP
jgi:hypothetical protein